MCEVEHPQRPAETAGIRHHRFRGIREDDLDTLRQWLLELERQFGDGVFALLEHGEVAWLTRLPGQNGLMGLEFLGRFLLAAHPKQQLAETIVRRRMVRFESD